MAKTKAQRYLALLQKGKSYSEIAAKHGVAYGTVYDAVRRERDPKYAKRRKEQARQSRINAAA